MKLKIVVHEAEEGGFRAEVPAICGCCTQGEDFEELFENLRNAIERKGWAGRPRPVRARTLVVAKIYWTGVAESLTPKAWSTFSMVS
jgi:hypothetical protein